MMSYHAWTGFCSISNRLLQQLRRQLADAREETERLRREGEELLNAYQRKKERAEQLREDFVDLEQHYAEKCDSEVQLQHKVAELQVSHGDDNHCHRIC